MLDNRFLVPGDTHTHTHTHTHGRKRNIPLLLNED